MSKCKITIDDLNKDAAPPLPPADPCVKAIPVFICPPNPPDPVPPPVVVDAPTCVDGVTLPINTKPELTTRVVQEEGTAFLVKLCEPQKDFEVERACNAAGESVLVQYDAGVIPPVELSRTNMLTGLAEPAGTLRKCDSDEIELVDLVACLNGVEIVGVAVMTDKDLPVMTGELWRDPVTGAWGPLPAGAVIGKCAQCEVTPLLEFGFYNSPAVSGGPVSRVGFLDGVNGNFSDPVAGQYEVLFTIDGVAQVGNGAGLFSNGDFPVLFSSIQSIADYFNSHPANTAPKDNWVAGPDFLVISNDPPNHAWKGMVSYHNNAGVNDYNHFKGDPEPVTVELVTAASCRKIEVIKFIDCNRDIVDIKGFEVNGTAIDNFDRSLLVAECPAAPKLVLNPVHWCDPNTQLCVEGKAWYAEDTGELIRLNLLNGKDITGTIDPELLQELGCPAAKITERLICGIISGGTEPQDVIERLVESLCAKPVVTYWNPLVSPMQEVTLDKFITHGKCSCCDLIPYI